MNVKKLIEQQKKELKTEHDRLSLLLTDTQQKILKTEGAMLMMQHFEKLLDKEK
jgi:hypothetical protein